MELPDHGGGDEIGADAEKIHVLHIVKPAVCHRKDVAGLQFRRQLFYGPEDAVLLGGEDALGLKVVLFDQAHHLFFQICFFSGGFQLNV